MFLNAVNTRIPANGTSFHTCLTQFPLSYIYLVLLLSTPRPPPKHIILHYKLET